MLRHTTGLVACLLASGCPDLATADPVADSEGAGSTTAGATTGPKQTTTGGAGGSTGSNDASGSAPDTGDSTDADGTDSTGTDGTDGTDSTGTSPCPPDPEPGGGFCPPICTNGCADDVCEIVCNSPGACTTIDCPPGFVCDVSCEGTEACDVGTVNCVDLACRVSCSDGNDACGDMHINCGAGASCSLSCIGGDGPCDGTILHCGSGPCTAECKTDIMPTVNPADSCQVINGCA